MSVTIHTIPAEIFLIIFQHAITRNAFHEFTFKPDVLLARTLEL